MSLPRRVRLLGLFNAIELDGELPNQLELMGWPWGAQEPMPDDPTYDPLSDPLDEPFPEELR